MKRQSACHTSRSMYPSIFNSIPVIRTTVAKNRRFYLPQPTFSFPLACDYHTICCMDGKTKQSPRRMYIYIFNSFRVTRCLSQCVSPKIAIFTYRNPHFCFPWRRPCDYHAICCMYGKTIQCLPNPSQHVPIYLQQFPSYSNRKCQKSPFSCTAAHIFVSPGDAPAIITQYVAWMERQFNACQTHRSIYLSIFNSFGVIRCLSQCIGPKIAIFTTFLFRPGGNHAKCCMDGKRI